MNKLNIDRKTLREWKENETSLQLVKNKVIKYRCNKTKGFIKVYNDEEEDQIYNGLLQKEKINYQLAQKVFVVMQVI